MELDQKSTDWALLNGEFAWSNCANEDMDHTVESVLESNQHILNLLKETVNIYSSDAEEFAAQVKPYLDATPTPEGIIAWPLISEVRLYVKSEILKHGLVLVDLPGLSDMVESRSAVAERYYQQLSVTTIVTPAIRAVDEKTGVKLMAKYQETRMQLDGKYHKDGFCVVISKVDDMDCDAFCKGSRDARQDAQLQADVAELMSISNRNSETYKQLRSAERKYDSMTRKCTSLKEKIDRLRCSEVITPADEAEGQAGEEHLDSLLRGLQRLYDGIRRWSDDNRRGMVAFSRKEIESLLQSSHDKYRKRLEAVLNRGAQEIKHLTPLRNKDEKLDCCKTLAVQAVSRWVYNNSQEGRWTVPEHRSGTPVLRLSIGTGHPFLNMLLEDWLGFFQVELPKSEEPLMGKAGEIWGQYMAEVQKHICDTACDIIPYFDGTAKTMSGIETEMCDKIRSSIKGIADGSSQIHPLFVATLRERLSPVFDRALQITGKGHFGKRQSQIRDEVQQSCQSMFSAGLSRMENEYNRRVGALPSDFRQDRQAVTGNDHTALDRKKQLQKAVRSLVLEWAAQWRAPHREEVISKDEPLHIPTEYAEELYQSDDENRASNGEAMDETETDTDSDGEDNEMDED
ncbi:hypothetical protein VTK56DRAFT_9992 [Thermocarpiscus australiensis]